MIAIIHKGRVSQHVQTSVCADFNLVDDDSCRFSFFFFFIGSIAENGPVTVVSGGPQPICPCSLELKKTTTKNQICVVHLGWFEPGEQKNEVFLLQLILL